MRNLLGTILVTLLPLLPLCAFGECPDLPSSSLGISNLKAVIRSPECGVLSIDDVLAKLPEKMKENFILFYRSQSLQGPHVVDYQYPRAILFSEQEFTPISQQGKRLFLSFNGHSRQPGFKNLEILEIDQSRPAPAVDLFNYFDVEFPEERQSQKLSWDEVQKQIKISEPNPAKCVACHGSPARPIFQAYPIWEGAYGSFHLTVNPVESVELEKLQRSVQMNGTSRYRHLIFKDASRILRGEINSIFNGALSSPNFLRISRLVQKDKRHEPYLPALAGALLSCTDFNSFIPDRIHTVIQRNLERSMSLTQRYSPSRVDEVLKPFHEAGEYQFGSAYSMGQGSSGAPGFGQPTLSYTTFKRAHFDYWQKSSIQFLLWIDTLSRQGRDRSDPGVSKVRYLMEGRGYDVSKWFMDIKQPTYRASDGGPWSQGIGFALIVDHPGLEKFRDLGQKSSHGNGYTEVSVAEHNKAQLCEQLRTESALRLSSVDLPSSLKGRAFDEVVRKGSFPTTFVNTCATCHTQNQIGPHIPFQSENQFRQWAKIGKNKDKVLHRITTQDELERMPLNRNLDEGELNEILEYLKLL